jgi:hypothetical protein
VNLTHLKFNQQKRRIGGVTPPYSTLQQFIFSRKKARRTRYLRRFKRFKPVILSLSPACLSAIASNIYSSELSRLVDLAIVQAETRYELEFAGFAS